MLSTKYWLLSVLIIGLSGYATAEPAPANDVIQSVTTANAETGRSLWLREVVAEEGPPRSCTTCHGVDLSEQGQHAKSGKVIEAMAPSVNSLRYTQRKKIAKWFKRNCKWTWGRECSTQEQADLMSYLVTQ